MRKILLVLTALLTQAANGSSNNLCSDDGYVMAKNAHRLECFIATTEARVALESTLAHDLDDIKLSGAAQKLALKYPNEAYIQIFAAAMLGDSGQVISEEAEIRNKRVAVDRLQLLLESNKNLPHFVVNMINNEIYYHSGLFYSQYILGISNQRKGWLRSGGFSAGVGASELAYQKLLDGKIEEAKDYAKKSIAGWQERAQGDSNFLAKQTFYIIAVAINGELEKASELFKKHRSTDKHAKAHQLWYEHYQRRLEKIEEILKKKT